MYFPTLHFFLHTYVSHLKSICFAAETCCLHLRFFSVTMQGHITIITTVHSGEKLVVVVVIYLILLFQFWQLCGTE